MDVTDHGLALRELADGVTEADIRAATGPDFTVELG
jgi:3-oxoacid CoA-transferase subunit B